MSPIKQVQAVLQKMNFSEVHVVHLDRTKPQGNRATAKAFAAKVDAALAKFQDSDMILVALTVNHKR